MKYGGKEFLLEYTASTWIGPVMKILPSGLTISMDLRWDSYILYKAASSG
jgi:hypothetical protein